MVREISIFEARLACSRKLSWYAAFIPKLESYARMETVHPRLLLSTLKCFLHISLWFSSDQRSSNVAPSDSERDCPSRRDSEPFNMTPLQRKQSSRLGVQPTGNDSESGGSHSPSPRSSRRKVRAQHVHTSEQYSSFILRTCCILAVATVNDIAVPFCCSGFGITHWLHCASCPTTPFSHTFGNVCLF